MQTEKEMNLYDLIEINLSQERIAGQDSKTGPRVLQTRRDCLVVLSLDGEANISIGHEDYFALTEKLKMYLPQAKTKTILITNIAQAGKELVLFLSNRKNLELIYGG